MGRKRAKKCLNLLEIVYFWSYTCLDVTADAPDTSIPKDSDNFRGTAELYSLPCWNIQYKI